MAQQQQQQGRQQQAPERPGHERQRREVLSKHAILDRVKPLLKQRMHEGLLSRETFKQASGGKRLVVSGWPGVACGEEAEEEEEGRGGRASCKTASRLSDQSLWCSLAAAPHASLCASSQPPLPAGCPGHFCSRRPTACPPTLPLQVAKSSVAYLFELQQDPGWQGLSDSVVQAAVGRAVQQAVDVLAG